MNLLASPTILSGIRQPSHRFLTSQSLFLEVNGSRGKRLQNYKSKRHHDTSYAFQLSQELEADLGFYCEAQREVDRLMDMIQQLKTQLLLQQTEARLDRSIIQDFARSKKLDLELIDFCIEQLRPRLENPAAKAA